MHQPENYLLINQSQRDCAESVIAEYSDVVREMKGRCLDIGCGPGDVSHDFILPNLHPTAELVCSDISEKMLDYGRKTYKDVDRMSFSKLDIATPELPSELVGQFNHALSFTCLHWCRDLKQVFENILQLLKPGGTTLLAFISRHPTLIAYQTLAATPKYQPYMTDVQDFIPVLHDSPLPLEDIRSIIEAAGLDVIECKMQDYIWFQSGETLEDFLVTINVFWPRIPQELRKEYRRDLARLTRKYCNDNQESTGDLNCKFSMCIAYLRKPLADGGNKTSPRALNGNHH